MRKFLTKPWLRSWSGLSINISAAWFVAPFIGANLTIPTSIWKLAVLIADLLLGIMFLLITVWCERRLQK